MQLAFHFSVAILIATAASPARADDAKDMQGKWAFEVMKFRGENAPDEALKSFQVTITGDKMSTPGDGMVTFKLDPSKTPKEIEFDEDGKKNYGIYSLDGGKLRFCFETEGTKRPKEFDSPAGSTIFLMVLKKP